MGLLGLGQLSIPEDGGSDGHDTEEAKLEKGGGVQDVPGARDPVQDLPGLDKEEVVGHEAKEGREEDVGPGDAHMGGGQVDHPVGGEGHDAEAHHEEEEVALVFLHEPSVPLEAVKGIPLQEIPPKERGQLVAARGASGPGEAIQGRKGGSRATSKLARNGAGVILRQNADHGKAPVTKEGPA